MIAHPHNTAKAEVSRTYLEHPNGKYWLIERFDGSAFYMIGWAAIGKPPQWRERHAPNQFAANREVNDRRYKKMDDGYVEKPEIPAIVASYYGEKMLTEKQRKLLENPPLVDGVFKVYPSSLPRRT